MRGGANGARIQLAPQEDWAVNNPTKLAKVLQKLKVIQENFNKSRSDGKQVSIVDLIVLSGAVAIETAPKNAGVTVEVPFIPGSADTTQEQTDIKSFTLLKPKADGFRNYFNKQYSYYSPVEILVDRVDQLYMTVPEMTVMVGGMRALDANTGGSKHGVFTSTPWQLTNDFFVNLLDMSTQWREANTDDLYEGMDYKTGQFKYTATSVDLIFGSNSELRAIREEFDYRDSKWKPETENLQVFCLNTH